MTSGVPAHAAWRQVGAVIGTAAVGALLQNRLFSCLTAQAQTRAAGLPPPVWDKLVTGFQQAAQTGAGVGSGQGGGFKPPAGAPPTASSRFSPTRRVQPGPTGPPTALDSPNSCPTPPAARCRSSPGTKPASPETAP